MKKHVIISIVIAVMFIALVSCAIWLSIQTQEWPEYSGALVVDKDAFLIYIYDDYIYRALIRIKPIELVDIVKDIKDFCNEPILNYKYPYNVIIKAELLEDYYENLDKPLDSEILLAFALLDYSDVEDNPIPPMQALADKILACDEMIVYSLYTNWTIQYESILSEETNDNTITTSEASLIPYNFGVIQICDGKVNYTDYRNVFCLYDDFLEEHGAWTKCQPINDGDGFEKVQQIVFEAMRNGSFGGESIRDKFKNNEETQKYYMG